MQATGLGTRRALGDLTQAQESEFLVQREREMQTHPTREHRHTPTCAHAGTHSCTHTCGGRVLRVCLARHTPPSPASPLLWGSSEAEAEASLRLQPHPFHQSVKQPRNSAVEGEWRPGHWGTKECSWLPSGPFTFCLVFWETNGKNIPVPTFLEADLYKQTRPDNSQSKQRNCPKSGPGAWAEGRG